MDTKLLHRYDDHENHLVAVIYCRVFGGTSIPNSEFPDFMNGIIIDFHIGDLPQAALTISSMMTL